MLKRILVFFVGCLAFAVAVGAGAMAQAPAPGQTPDSEAGNSHEAGAGNKGAGCPSRHRSGAVLRRPGDLRRPDLARRQVHRVPQAVQGTRNIWVKKTDEPFDAARPITADTKRPIPAISGAATAKYILYVQDQGGDENYNVYAVDPAARPRRAPTCRRRATSRTPRECARPDLRGAEERRRT